MEERRAGIDQRAALCYVDGGWCECEGEDGEKCMTWHIFLEAVTALVDVLVLWQQWWWM